MNPVLDVVKKRRSIRKYLPDQIKDNELAIILEAGTFAPSGHNCQPWHFTVIQNKEIINHINKKTKQQMVTSEQEWAVKMGRSEKYHVFHHAPTVLIISGSKDEKSPLPLAETGQSYTPLVDCVAAIQNILLAAESLNIGSCLIGVVNYLFILPNEVEQLGIPNNYQPYFAVTLGYKDNSAALPIASARKGNIISYIR